MERLRFLHRATALDTPVSSVSQVTSRAGRNLKRAQLKKTGSTRQHCSMWAWNDLLMVFYVATCCC